MDIPYGFDCYAFIKNEVKYFEPNIVRVKHSATVPYKPANVTKPTEARDTSKPNYIMFTRKNEDYSKEQLQSLIQAGRLNVSEANGDKKIFCGIKIQIGIGVVTNFLQEGLQYRPPIRGRSELTNGSWTGIVSGLTIDHDRPTSYDIAFGNFLAYDEEFPYIKFGPFFAIESKLVMLTGSSRQIEASSFGTNMNGEVWLIVSLLMLILSLLAAFRVHWQHTKNQAVEEAIRLLAIRMETQRKSSKLNALDARSDHSFHRTYLSEESLIQADARKSISVLSLIQNFFFIYTTMLLNKPSLEFDDLIWPKHSGDLYSKERQYPYNQQANDLHSLQSFDQGDEKIHQLFVDNKKLVRNYQNILGKRKKHRHLPTSIRVLSYLWSAACLVMASIYSGEMLAVILLHADQNIDTISQLINSKPPIEPVIRQDDFTYNLMLKSLDKNMLVLHNMTKIIPRPEVYTRRFIEGVSNRKQALLGDDELIETIYDIYHKYYPLYKSKVTYLQYPISIMYRKDFNSTLERKLRRGIVQIFEMGLIQRWYQAQKDTYIQFYDTFEKNDTEIKDETLIDSVTSDQKYKPLSMHHFESFLKLITMCELFAFVVLGLEIIHYRLTRNYFS